MSSEFLHTSSIIIFANVVAYTISYPIEVWKIRKQISETHQNTPECFIEAFGWGIFWQGIIFELISVVIGTFLRCWFQWDLEIGSALFAALFVAFVRCPFEWKKIQVLSSPTALDVDDEDAFTPVRVSAAPYSTCLDALWVMLLRDFVKNGFYLATSYLILSGCSSWSLLSQLIVFAILLSVSVLLSHQFDVVKTAQQQQQPTQLPSSNQLQRTTGSSPSMMAGHVSVAPYDLLTAGLWQRLLHENGRFFLMLLWVRALSYVYNRGNAIPYALALQIL